MAAAPDWKTASWWLLEAGATGGDTEAQFELGNRFIQRFASPKREPRDAASAVGWYRRAAESGHANAQYRLALAYANGEGVRGSDTEAAKWFRKAGEQGNAWAQFRLGEWYQVGRGVPRDATQATEWFTRASSKGHDGAAARLRALLPRAEDTPGRETQPATAHHHAQNNPTRPTAPVEPTAAAVPFDTGERDHCDASDREDSTPDRIVTTNPMEAAYSGAKSDELDPKRETASAAASGLHDKPQRKENPDYTLLRELLKRNDPAHELVCSTLSQSLVREGAIQINKRLSQNSRPTLLCQHTESRELFAVPDFDLDGPMPAAAQLAIGQLYQEGSQTQKNEEKAAQWFRKAAEQGMAAAQHSLGDCYYNAQGVTQDYVEAVKYYRKAAELGMAAAQLKLGQLLERGVGTPRNYSEAAVWYRKAADQGDGDAQWRLAWLHTGGWGVKQDDAVALAWIRKGALQGHAGSQFSLAYRYEFGANGPPDFAESMAWYRKAAQQGFYPADFRIGVHFRDGLGVTPDRSEAEKWFRNAAEQGFKDAQEALCNLASEDDMLQGLPWIAMQDDKVRDGAELGIAGAQCELGKRLHIGTSGVKQDVEAAYRWYRKAADQGLVEAYRRLGSLFVQKDVMEATKWYRKAAERGDIGAQNALRSLAERTAPIPRRDLPKATTVETTQKQNLPTPAREERLWPTAVGLCLLFLALLGRHAGKFVAVMIGLGIAYGVIALCINPVAWLAKQFPATAEAVSKLLAFVFWAFVIIATIFWVIGQFAPLGDDFELEPLRGTGR